MKKLDIYTDGSCFGNPGPGGWAFIIKDKNGKILKKIPRIDNNNNILETPDGSYFNVNVNKLKKFVGKIK